MAEPFNSVFFFPLILSAAYALDLAAGDPVWMPHPVRCIGCGIVLLEGLLRRFAKTPFMERLSGVLLCIVIAGLAYGLSAALLYISRLYSIYIYSTLSVFFVWTSLAVRSLHTEASEVARSLKEEGIVCARARLARIVGRDTENLTEAEVLRAAAESVAENTSDGIVAPLFYLALGGPALMLAYKAVSTLDSMVGYKNRRYIRFGWFSARADDIANYIPARLTALLMVIASFMLGYNWKGSLKTLIRDGRNHPSPNSGMPEAAVAGALGVRFGGRASYGGVESVKPFIGGAVTGSIGGVSPETLRSSIWIMHVTALLMAAITVFIRLYATFIL